MKHYIRIVVTLSIIPILLTFGAVSTAQEVEKKEGFWIGVYEARIESFWSAHLELPDHFYIDPNGGTSHVSMKVVIAACPDPKNSAHWKACGTVTTSGDVQWSKTGIISKQCRDGSISREPIMQDVDYNGRSTSIITSGLDAMFSSFSFSEDGKLLTFKPRLPTNVEARVNSSWVEPCTGKKISRNRKSVTGTGTPPYIQDLTANISNMENIMWEGVIGANSPAQDSSAFVKFNLYWHSLERE